MEKVIPLNDSVIDHEKMSLTELANYIESVHHTYVRKQLPEIQRCLMEIYFQHGETFPYLREVLLEFEDMLEEFGQHLLKEEKILFPRIRQLEMEEQPHNSINFLSAPIEIIEDEHEEAGYHLQAIKKLTSDYSYPSNACETHKKAMQALKEFEEDLKEHVYLEDQVLFPKAVEKYRKINPMIY